MSTFDNIKKFSKKRGWNLRQTAEKAGLSPNAIYRYNQGVEPKYPTLKAIADALGVKVSDLSDEYKDATKIPAEESNPTKTDHIDVEDIVDNAAMLTSREHALSDEDRAAIKAMLTGYLNSKEGQDRLKKYGGYGDNGKNGDD
ncbi:helix-turn-helix transcriptional regulator [Levilactobacillus brevis]|uniref:Helix-turn-helix transcriptional regulator n=1 Tax=Levilactobacillus brevis TaxID=1580 RepID=A0AA41JUB4_LEVBR|nr:helix-turn-helix transcriptional regulator [Levilactobacillus brevis]MBS0948339.1 helix-turn-helix transcriptional regulator [Levilactobacillus brevis]MBS1011484.1 helix-turn-helix transcriptional regulator [Levilactobacillus brevis]